MPEIDAAVIQNDLQMFMVNRSELARENQQGSHASVESADRRDARTSADGFSEKHADIAFAGAVASHLHVFGAEIRGNIVCDVVFMLFPVADVRPARTADNLPVGGFPGTLLEFIIIGGFCNFLNHNFFFLLFL